MGDAHTKHDQQRSGNNGKVGEELEKRGIRCSGYMKEGAHNFKNDPDLKNNNTTTLHASNQYNEPDVGHGTHLTVYRSCTVKAEHVENHGQKG